MKYVVDASVALKWVLPEAQSGRACKLRDDFQKRLHELLSRATEISSQSRQGVYDCLYVALADREQCELLTADQRLLQVLGKQFPFIASLSALP